MKEGELCWTSPTDTHQSLPDKHILPLLTHTLLALDREVREAERRQKTDRESSDCPIQARCCHQQKMAVSISRDLSVQVLDDPNKVKLTDRQQQLHAAIQKGEPKCLGLSQVMLGLMVMTYSLPLHFTEHTHVVIFGVPWWTGLTFIAAGSIAMTLDKHFSTKIVQVCLVTSVAAMVLSAVAVIIYSVDLYKHQLPLCETVELNPHYLDDPCKEQISATKFSKGLKSSLLFFTLVQAAISAVFCWLLYRQKHIFAQYAAINLASSSYSETN